MGIGKQYEYALEKTETRYLWVTSLMREYNIKVDKNHLHFSVCTWQWSFKVLVNALSRCCRYGNGRSGYIRGGTSVERVISCQPLNGFYCPELGGQTRSQTFTD